MSVRNVHDESSQMGDTIDEVRRHRPNSAFLHCELNICESLVFVHDDRMHAAIFVGIVDQIGGEESVRHFSRELICKPLMRHTFQSINATLDKMCHRHPRIQVLSSIAAKYHGSGKMFRLRCAIIIYVIPHKFDAVIDIARTSSDTNELWLRCVGLDYEALRNLHVGNVQVLTLDGSSKLLRDVLAECVSNVSVNRLATC